MFMVSPFVDTVYKGYLFLFYYKIVHVVQNNEKKIHETIKNKGNMQ